MNIRRNFAAHDLNGDRWDALADCMRRRSPELSGKVPSYPDHGVFDPFIALQRMAASII
jgi:hypothetical protein